MYIYLTVYIETQGGLFKRASQTPHNVSLTDGEWKPHGGILFYPDRRATKISVWAPDYTPGEKASGSITVTEPGVIGGVSPNTLTVDLNEETINVSVEDGQSRDTIASYINNAINSQSENYISGVNDNVVDIIAKTSGANYNGPITVNIGSTGTATTHTDLAGGTNDMGPKNDFRLVKTFTFESSNTTNYAFVEVESIDMSSFEDNAYLNLADYNNNNERFNNRVKASEVNLPYLFDPASTYYVGKGGDDQVIGFASNSLPISQGQFGQYPLFVMCKDSIWALQQSSQPLIAFGSVTPYSLTHGLGHKKGMANIERSVAFLFGKRIYILRAGNIEEIGRPIQKLLTGEEKLAYYNYDGQSELWVIAPSKTLIYNLFYGLWYSMDRDTKDVVAIGNDLYSITSDGFFLNEHDLNDLPVSVSIATNPVHYGYPDILKRVYYAILRATFKTLTEFSITFEQTGKKFTAPGKYIRPRHPSDFSFTVNVGGTMTPESDQYIHRIDTEFEARYVPKLRQSQTTPEQ